MILPIYIYGHPVLRKVAQDVDPQDECLKELIANMFETMDHAQGIGLAAPQVGLSKRVVVIDLDVLSDDLPEYKGFRRAFINPHIVEIDENAPYEQSEEGCLSVPGIHEKVNRSTRIHVTYIDEDLNPHDEWVEGYLARVMQHEFDHLDAKMFVDRISPFRKQMLKNKLKSMSQGKYQCNYRTKPVT